MAQKRSPHFSSTPSFSQPTCVCVLLCTYDVSGLVKLCIFFILGMFSQDLWPKPIGFVCVCIVIWCSLLLPSLSWHFPRHWVISCSITVGLNQMSSPPLRSLPTPWLLPALPCLGPVETVWLLMDILPPPDSLDPFFFPSDFRSACVPPGLLPSTGPLSSKRARNPEWDDRRMELEELI